jgi:hypothetical protein
VTDVFSSLNEGSRSMIFSEADFMSSSF